MAIDTATFEATLDSKIDAATTSNSPTEFLLLAKAVEATNAAVSSSSLAVSNNLSDVANSTTALTNLGAAGLASPAFTGTPTAPTATAGTNTTQIATTAFVAGEVAGFVDSAPATLDTLNELAAALGDDASFSTTVTNSIATKLPLAGGTMTSTLEVNPSSNVAQIALTQSNVGANGDGWKLHSDGPNGGVLKIQRRSSGTDTTVITVQTNGQLVADNGISGSYTNLHPEVTTANVSSSQTIDMTKPMHHFDMTAATAFSGVSIAAGRTSMMVLDTTATPHTPTWGSDIKWPDATEPTWADSRYWIVSMTCLDGSIILASASGYTV